MISRNWNLPQLFIFKLVKMELATIISLSTLLAATYSMNFLNKLKKSKYGLYKFSGTEVNLDTDIKLIPSHL